MNCLMTAWHQHEAELRGWLRHRLGKAADAEDLLQDVFLKAMRQGERFCAIVDARAWLYAVARNTLADRLRISHDTVELPEDLSANTESVAAVDSLAACLPRVLSELSPEDREAITLCDLERLPQEEYARRTGLSLPGAKSRVQRAQAAARAAHPSLPRAPGRGRAGERFRAARAARLRQVLSIRRQRAASGSGLALTHLCQCKT